MPSKTLDSIAGTVCFGSWVCQPTHTCFCVSKVNFKRTLANKKYGKDHTSVTQDSVYNLGYWLAYREHCL